MKKLQQRSVAEQASIIRHTEPPPEMTEEEIAYAEAWNRKERARIQKSIKGEANGN